MMDEKLTYSEVMEIVNKVYNDYMGLYERNKMNFSEFSILANALMSINEKLKEDMNNHTNEDEYVEEDIGYYMTNNTSWEKFRKIPVVIEAFQTFEEVEIETLEGTMKADKGDWIIKGVKGELYPCKPDVFNMTYEKVEQ